MNTKLMILTLAFPMMVQAADCGLSGSIDDRVRDCGFSYSGRFSLISRSGGKEIHLDGDTGLLWGSRLTVPAWVEVYQEQARQLCAAQKDLGLEWRLPTVLETKIAFADGLSGVFPSQEYYWTNDSKSAYSDGEESIWGYIAALRPKEVFVDYGSGTAAVRCVALQPPLNR